MTREEAIKVLEVRALTTGELLHRFNESIDTVTVTVLDNSYLPSEILRTDEELYDELFNRWLEQETERGHLVQLDNGYYTAKDYLAIELLAVSTKNRKA